MFLYLYDSKVFEKLFNADKTLAEKFINAVKRAIEKLRQFFKENPTYARTEYGKALQEAMSKVENRVQELWDEAVVQGIRAENKESRGTSYSFVGRTEDGKSIYKTNYPANTTKNVKRQDIVDFVQNIWSKKPVRLTIIENGVPKEIIAKFNPELTPRSDLSKIAFGNRKGNASDRRMTLDLSADLYQIAEESVYDFSKDETGKDNPAHENVTRWHYFVTNLIYRDNNNNDIECNMLIDVKENDKGNWFYSFAIEKGAAPQTLLAAVTEENSATVPTNNIPQSSEKINTPDEKSSDRFDTDYLSAVERGDMKTAQKMVDEAAKAAGYDIHLYHGAKSGGGFTVFKDWQYFTKNKPYAERYTQRETGKGLYDVFVKSSRMFDTRNADDRAIFEQYRNEYGMSELTDNGLPDWTDGYDLSEIIEENNLDYDGIILNEGGDLVNEKPVSRGASYVIRNSSQIKSADPVTYDDDGNVIPLSERFNEEKEDIRYQDRFDEYDNLFDMGEDLFEDDSKREIFDEMIEKYPDDALYIIMHAAEQTVENFLTNKNRCVALSACTAVLYINLRCSVFHLLAQERRRGLRELYLGGGGDFYAVAAEHYHSAHNVA